MLTALLLTAVRLSDKRAITVRRTCAVTLVLKAYICAVHISAVHICAVHICAVHICAVHIVFSCLFFRLSYGRFS